MQRVLTSSKHKEKSVKHVCNGGQSKCGTFLKMPHLDSSPRGENMFPRACYCCALLMARLN